MERSDYNSIVYAWFERSGIISNIRTQLRQNLVNALKGKDMTLSKVNAVPKSAKQYVYDLLIAEYLWNHNYAYTLSVFASEAPLLVNFRNDVPQSNETANINGNHHKLQTDYVLHTLETLGINPKDSDGQLILSEYEKNDVPLLLTILKFMCHSLYLRIKKTDELSSKCIQNNGTQTDTFSHDIILEKSKIIAAKKKLLRQRDLYNNRLKDKEAELNKRASKIEEQLIVLNEKLSHAQIMMQGVIVKERKLIKKKKELSQLDRKNLNSSEERSSIQKTKRPEKDQDNYQLFKSDLKKIQEESAKVQREIFTKNKNENLIIKISKREICTQTEVQGDVNYEIRKDDEKLELQNLVEKQKLRIEELTLRAIRLARQLEETQLVKSSTVEIIKPKVQMSKINSVLSESSSTDDIIQDAKQRLKRLEEESLKADQSYFNCITNFPFLR
ncbi:uncharacterized protein [Chelonus insularis]|uniref:uncharacterized protein n=1 Tax=Chelonus insularis TaxID=460826 RepID=UPI001588892B|nr:uncharacterized protein LOC118069350 [Chelonus insularis]XP_034943292.1 uncharacterized protein LOC118069350 [Chelonus insularis]